MAGPAFDGWTLITTGDKLAGGSNGFEIWSTGDNMADSAGTMRSVNAMAGNGNRWLELNDAGARFQTLGVQRDVVTQEGASYTLSFDLAGRPGYSSAFTQIGVYVDGVKLAAPANTSPTSALAWQTASYTFTGTGASQRIRIVTESTAQDAGGRGMMVDDIALTETVRLNQGLEAGPLTLQGLSAALTHTDASETLLLTLTGMPIGSVLSDGVRTFTVTDAQRIANLTGWDTSALTLRAPVDYSGHLTLQAQATSIETATGARATLTQTLQVDIAGAADAPTVTLAPRAGNVSREIVATSWETVANASTAATVVTGTTLEGWKLVPPASGKTSAFEVWAANDRMRNSTGTLVTVQPAAGNGTRWLSLTNGVISGSVQTYQTLGVERVVDTIDKAVYTLTLDYAAAMGLALGSTQIGIYVDGVRLATYANTSPNTGLNWQALSFQFDGNGAPRTVRIVLEGGSGTTSARGAMIDDIRVVETLPDGTGIIYGLANTAIALPAVDARLTDIDGSETLKLELLGAPVGAVISDGTRSVTIVASGTAVDLAGWDWARLSLRPASGFTGTLQLQLRATSSETRNGASASVTQPITVNVLAGTQVATPVGVNPFVTLFAGATTASTPGTQTPGQIVLSTPIVSATGSLTFTSTLPAPRTWEEEEAADQQRVAGLGDAWLRELETAAKANWVRLMGGRVIRMHAERGGSSNSVCGASRRSRQWVGRGMGGGFLWCLKQFAGTCRLLVHRLVAASR